MFKFIKYIVFGYFFVTKPQFTDGIDRPYFVVHVELPIEASDAVGEVSRHGIEAGEVGEENRLASDFECLVERTLISEADSPSMTHEDVVGNKEAHAAVASLVPGILFEVLLASETLLHELWREESVQETVLSDVHEVGNVRFFHSIVV